MDRKERTLINYYYEKLLDNRLDEKDVYAFLILISNKSTGNSCLQELAGFVVSRGTKPGVVTEYLCETRNKFANLGKMNTALKIEEVFSFKEIKNGINHVLVDCGLKGISNEQVNDIIMCVISILQHVKITENGREIGRLFFAIASKQVMLMAEVEIVQNGGGKKTNVVFPVLTAKNNYASIKKQDKYDAPYFFEEKVIEIINQDGKLEINFVGAMGSDPQSTKV
ncbi:hypothetical protein J7E79_01220 [Bacillus sp. ISL-40]|uniref:hypothetical protein n=1 Tax=unclassified Bacillus (in: firmicutes) TaxID=185979 RepID=UPI001BE728D1|nr:MULTISPECIES: hypothetical protein [unclassified Bacillus (in: firmicutes)]MBT2696065.1 hypothetical protein [Bacillus sp. ISL-40]MBT2743955.1 hypothetical protein [Bacillus sp. ISL-77]